MLFVNRAVELLKAMTRNIPESPEVGPHATDQLVVVQEGHEIVLVGFTGQNEFVYVEGNEPFGVGHANHHVLQQTLSADRVPSWTATFVIVFMVGRPNVRHISAVDHEVGQTMVVLVVDNIEMLHTQRSIMLEPPIEPFLGVLDSPALRSQSVVLEGGASLVETVMLSNHQGGRQLVLVPTLCQGWIDHRCQLLSCLVVPIVYLQRKRTPSQLFPNRVRDIEMSHYDGAGGEVELIETYNGKGIAAKRYREVSSFVLGSWTIVHIGRSNGHHNALFGRQYEDLNHVV